MKKFIFLVFICGAMLFGGESVHAQAGTFDLSSTSINSGYKLTEPSVPYIDPDGDGRTDLSDYLAGLFRLMIGIAAIGSIVVIIIGGFEYIASATPFGKSEGKKRIQNAFWGLGLVLFSYLIINTINPAILQFNPDTIIPVLVVEKDIALSSKDQYERRLLALGIESKELKESLQATWVEIPRLREEAKKALAANNPQLANELTARADTLETADITASVPQIVKNYVVRYDTSSLAENRFTALEINNQKTKLNSLLEENISRLQAMNKTNETIQIQNLQKYAMESMSEIARIATLRDARMTNAERVNQIRAASLKARDAIPDQKLRAQFITESTARMKIFQ